MSALAPLREASDSMAKASTPEPFSTSRTSNWIAKLGGLPPYVQHIAHDLLEKKRALTESRAIQMAIGIMKHPPSNWGADARAAAAKAAAQWEKLKGENAGKAALQHSDYRPMLADVIALREAALERLVIVERQFGSEGLGQLVEAGYGVPCPHCGQQVALSKPEKNVGTKMPKMASMSASQDPERCEHEGLQEAAMPKFAPELRRTASASGEKERVEVHHDGQMLGTISRRGGLGRGDGDRYVARAVNGEAVAGQYDNPLRSKDQALTALATHLTEAPARVISMPTSGKYLVARPSTYGQTTYSEFPSEPAARHAAGLPPTPTLPERVAQVAKLGEMVRFDLLTLSGEDIPPLARVQEARRRVPLVSA